MGAIKRPSGAIHSKKRKGRGPGTGNGTTAGRGNKGQNARSGGGVRPGFEGGQMPLYRRIARRGFSNYPFKIEYETLSVGTLEKSFKKGETVSLETLREKKLIGNNDKYVKILSDGEIKKSLTIDGLKVSRPALAKIEAAGGSVIGMESTAEAEAPAEAAPAEAAEAPAEAPKAKAKKAPAKPEEAAPEAKAEEAKADDAVAEAATAEAATAEAAPEEETSAESEETDEEKDDK